MRILVVKLTSMGDALHLLPALSDLQASQKDVTVDWMIEDSFAEIPAWHSSVDRVIRVSTRRWRKFDRAIIKEFVAFWRHLRAERYDVVVDAQGLMKSAVFARFARLKRGGRRAGFSGRSIKESPAAWLYKKTVQVERGQHAIDRLRKLFAGVFGYAFVPSVPRYKVNMAQPQTVDRGSVMFCHGTTWPSKHLPDHIWRELVDLADDDGYRVKLAWGNQAEKARAEWIAEGAANVTILPKSTLTELSHEIASVSGMIAVDTGLGHLAAALGVPCVSVYGSTDASLTGTAGEGQLHRQSSYHCSPCLLKNCPKLNDQVRTPPCYQSLDAASLWQSLYQEIV